jgi:uncharacterized protein (TIGR03435 family)
MDTAQPARVGAGVTGAVVMLGVIAAIAVGVATPSQAPAGSTAVFEVASIKPNTSGIPVLAGMSMPAGGRFTATNATLQELINFAYITRGRMHAYRIIGGDDWTRTARYDVNATSSDARATSDQILSMMKSLLADRFKLAVRSEARELATYALVVQRADGRLGPQLRRSLVDCEALRAEFFKQAKPAGPAPCGIRFGRGQLLGQAGTLDQLAEMLAPSVDRKVVNETGLVGSYDWQLEWAVETPRPALPSAADSGALPTTPAAATSNLPVLPAALQEQLGLRLDSRRGPVDVVVIERAERPTEN